MLTPQDYQTINDVVRQVLRSPAVLNSIQQELSWEAPLVYLGKTVGSVAASSGDTPGTGTVKLVGVVNGSAADWLDAEGNTVTKTVYNWSASSIADDEIVQLKQEIITGTLMVDFERCPA